MPQFMALYTGSPQAAAASGWDKLDETTRKAREREGMEAWGAWQEKNKASVVVAGGPLGKTKRADKSGVSDTSNAIAGYIIIEAPSHEAAAKLFENHPHFAIFPGEAVEIMPCMAIPTLEE